MIELSVIIPTRNRAKNLFNTLLSIEKQSLDQVLFEVIVCDNNSTDNTETVSNYFANRFLNFRYVKNFKPGLHVGRNKGFQEAKGDVLVYADDDIEAFPDWLQTINEVFRDDEVMLVGGKNLPKWETSPPKWALKMWSPRKDGHRILESYSIIDLGNEIKEIDPYLVFGCNFSIRKAIIDKTKGFHPDGMPHEIIEYRGDGESAISRYIKSNKLKTIYHPKASVYHLVSTDRLTIDYLRRRAFNQGVSDSYASIRNSKLNLPKKNISIKSIFKKVSDFLLKFFKNNLNILMNPVDKAMSEGYKEGFAFHRYKVEECHELKSWVMKDNYL